VSSESAARGILQEARHHDLIALVPHRKSMIHDVFLGTTIEKVLRLSSKPILAVPAADRVRGGPAPRLLAKANVD
jgi:hypothetical protein